MSNKCLHCGKIFCNLFSLERHNTKSRCSKKYKKLKCRYCSTMFETKNELILHFKDCKCLLDPLNNNEYIRIQQDYNTLVKIYEEYKQTKEEEIKRLIEQNDKLLEKATKPSTVNINNNNVVTNNITFRNYLATCVEPITDMDVKTNIKKLTYRDLYKGPVGIAEFLCNKVFNQKFITTDTARRTIMYNTETTVNFKDKECNHLIYSFFKYSNNELSELCNQTIEDLNRRIRELSSHPSISDDTVSNVVEAGMQKEKVYDIMKLSECAKKGEYSEYNSILNIHISKQGLTNKMFHETTYTEGGYTSIPRSRRSFEIMDLETEEPPLRDVVVVNGKIRNVISR